MNSIEFSKRITRKYRVKQKRPLFTALVLLKYPAGFSTIIFRQKKIAYSLNFTYQFIDNVKYTSWLNLNNGVYLKALQEQKSFLNILPGSILNGAVTLPSSSKFNLSALSLNRNTLIRAFNYINSIFERIKNFEGYTSSLITGPKKLFLNLFNRNSSVRQTGIAVYPINNPAYPESRFQLSAANTNYFLTHNSFLAQDNTGQRQFINRPDWRTADKRIKGFARSNGQTKEMTTGINQRINKYFPARLESKYRVDDGHEQSFFNKQDLLINNFQLPAVRNNGKLHEISSMKSSGSKKTGAHDNNYGTGGDHNPFVFNNREPLIKISNIRQSAIHKNGKPYAADSRKVSESGKSRSFNNRFVFPEKTASFSMPGKRVKPSGDREMKPNYTIFNLRHINKAPGLIQESAYRHESGQQPQSYPAFFPRLEMAVNQADRRQALSRNETGAEVTVRELIRKTSVIDSPQVDVNGIAEQVYGVIMRKIRLEKERRGK